MSKINWLHLDFKGIHPAHEQMRRWISWFSSAGFNGIVLEYENRLPWQTWPHAYRPGLSLAAWRDIWQHMQQLGMQIVPLIQTHGHLEWLLKDERYADWRENGYYNELCPQHPDVMPHLEQWLDEVIELHPPLEYIHIGGDETWNLATCPKCTALADASSDGKLVVFLEHLGRMIDLVVKRGLKPIIWGDMFWREARMDLVKQLPPEVVICDWQYSGSGPWTTTAELAAEGHTVFGASAARCSFNLSECLSPQSARLENVRGWQQQSDVAGVIHTCWSRGRSLLPLYGPWSGWLPPMILAGEKRDWESHPLKPWMAKVDDCLNAADVKASAALIKEMKGVTMSDAFDQACFDWWVLALRWHVLLAQATAYARNVASVNVVKHHIGIDPHHARQRREAAQGLEHEVQTWADDVYAYFDEHKLSDAQEFVESRLAACGNWLPAETGEPVTCDQ